MANFRADDNKDVTLVLTVYIIAFITGFPTNILALYTFINKVWKKPSPIDILLMNLTLSDLLLLIFLPFKMKEAASNFKWFLPYALCPLTGFIFYSSIYISILFLTAVSVERYIGVAFPIKYKVKKKPLYAIMASAFIWVFASAHCSIVYIIQYKKTQNASNDTCFETFTPDQLKVLLPVRLELFVVLFLIPLLITTYAYINFVRILMSLPHKDKERKIRAVSLVIVTLIIYIACFGPYNISHVIGYQINDSPTWRKYALLMSTINTTLDPIIFYFSSTAVKKSFGHIFGGIIKKISSICKCKLTCCNTVEKEETSTVDKSLTFA
ncbi:free fatty acid receptor 2-like [Protopterus annectens]|uniref:free fatty acid receptor 2-like n=1 Tax=Protopterus annectens TaxID=7888 RepID=UPI001CFB209C|nr:free fatty acid receptor 2-like [Protopterus annectens]